MGWLQLLPRVCGSATQPCGKCLADSVKICTLLLFRFSRRCLRIIDVFGAAAEQVREGEEERRGTALKLQLVATNCFRCST